MLIIPLLLACVSSPPAPAPAPGGGDAPEAAPSPLPAAQRDLSGLTLSEAGIGPFKLGTPGAEMLAMKGAQRAEPDCPCAYNVTFSDVKITAQVAAGSEAVCGVYVTDPARVGLEGPVVALADRYGEPIVEPATGDVRFANASWLAVQTDPVPGDDNVLPQDARVSGVLVGGCGE